MPPYQNSSQTPVPFSKLRPGPPAGILLLPLALVLFVTGCPGSQKAQPAGSAAARRQRDPSMVLQRNIADSLNNLADAVDVDLTPPTKLLDSASTSDKKEAMAIATVNPEVPDGPVNFLAFTSNNVDLRRAGVRPGDVLRYYAALDEESLERGIEQRTHIELRVRRLATQSPERAVIIEGGLNQPMTVPQRIEVWRYSDRRLNEIFSRLSYYVQRGEPMVDWEPTPDERELQQLVERMNQWLRNAADNAPDWKRTPLLDGLPQPILAAGPIAAAISQEALADGRFSIGEAREIQSYVWARDISDWARGDGLEAAENAAELFDWTIRNTQLYPDDAPGFAYHLWQVLMYGQATAAMRGLAFVELCRQQQLDAVILTGDDNLLLVGVLAERGLLLYDPRYGLPVPGEKEGSVATLAEVRANPELLRQLDTEEQTYPLNADKLDNLQAWLPATPLQLSKRAARIQGFLKGQEAVALTADVDAIVQRLQEAGVDLQPKLWPGTLVNIAADLTMSDQQRQMAGSRFFVFGQRPRLWRARVLHFQGTKDVSPSERDDPLAEPRRGHRQASKLYTDPRIRPQERLLRQLEPAKQIIYRTAKSDAAYWQALLRYDLGMPEVALNWLDRVESPVPGAEPWAGGLLYNRARCLEALDNPAEAAELLRTDQSPQRQGNLVRARQLAGPAEPPTDDDPTEEPAEAAPAEDGVAEEPAPPASTEPVANE